jgi:hypothetical protein
MIQAGRRLELPMVAGQITACVTLPTVLYIIGGVMEIVSAPLAK